MVVRQTALRIVSSDAKAQRSVVAELIIQKLAAYGAFSEEGADALENVDLLVTTGPEFAATVIDHPALLILDATDANKKSLLGKIGFHTSGDAWAYFVAEIGPGSFRVVELPRDDSIGVHPTQITSLDDSQPLPAELARSATRTTVTRDRPDLAVEELVSKIFDHRIDKGGNVASKAGDPPIPPGVKKWVISYTLLKTETITNFGKTQNPSLSITYDIIAFLNNPPSGRHYQYVYIHQKGVVNPGNLMDYSTYYKGYGQFHFATSIYPTTHLDDLLYDASSPPNVNDKHTVSTKIGITVDYAEKDGAHAKFDYEESISQDVFDWQIIEKTAKSHMQWVFAERYPVDYQNINCGADSGDWAPFDYWDRVKEFPNLTRYSLQPHTQSVWRTADVLKEPVTFYASVGQQLRYFWYRFLWFECLYASVQAGKSLTVDLSKVSE